MKILILAMRLYYFRDPDVEPTNPIFWLQLLPLFILIFLLILAVLPTFLKEDQSLTKSLVWKKIAQGLARIITKRKDNLAKYEKVKNRINTGLLLAQKLKNLSKH